MDVRSYIGLPFVDRGRDHTGVDCWGLVALVLREQCGIEVPSYVGDYASSQEGAEVAALIARESLGWQAVPLHEAQAGDVLVLRVHGRPWHCGLVVDRGQFLHADRRAGVVIERWDALLWARRVESAYRHRRASHA
jgi:cell wall-associated NlpC family hydrolase